jgi:peroxiredoxin family protein
MSDRLLAVILASGDLERLYTGLSILVSASAEGRPVRGLATFGALGPLVDPELERRALDPRATPDLSAEGRVTFARSLCELRDLAAPDLRACAASAQGTGLADRIAGRLAGVEGMPRFLRETTGGELLVV